MVKEKVKGALLGGLKKTAFFLKGALWELCELRYKVVVLAILGFTVLFFLGGLGYILCAVACAIGIGFGITSTLSIRRSMALIPADGGYALARRGLAELIVSTALSGALTALIRKIDQLISGTEKAMELEVVLLLWLSFAVWYAFGYCGGMCGAVIANKPIEAVLSTLVVSSPFAPLGLLLFGYESAESSGCVIVDAVEGMEHILLGAFAPIGWTIDNERSVYVRCALPIVIVAAAVLFAAAFLLVYRYSAEHDGSMFSRPRYSDIFLYYVPLTLFAAVTAFIVSLFENHIIYAIPGAILGVIAWLALRSLLAWKMGRSFCKIPFGLLGLLAAMGLLIYLGMVKMEETVESFGKLEDILERYTRFLSKWGY